MLWLCAIRMCMPQRQEHPSVEEEQLFSKPLLSQLLFAALRQRDSSLGRKEMHCRQCLPRVAKETCYTTHGAVRSLPFLDFRPELPLWLRRTLVERYSMLTHTPLHLSCLLAALTHYLCHLFVLLFYICEYQTHREFPLG